MVVYITHTRDITLRLEGVSNEVRLEGWVDVDFGGCVDTCRSRIGYVFKLCGSIVDWQSKRQATVAQIDARSRIRRSVRSVLRGQVFERHPSRTRFSSIVYRIHCANQCALRLALYPGTHPRIKYIDIKHHAIREMIENGAIEVEYVESENQEAIILTKSLPGPRHERNLPDLRLTFSRGIDGCGMEAE